MLLKKELWPFGVLGGNRVGGQLCWQWKSFQELSVQELHALFVLRAQVFVVEQNCAYQDPDTDDLCSLHLLGKDGEKLVAYLRVIIPDKAGKLKIGRIVVARDHRQYGLGKKAIELGVARCLLESAEGKIHISAQAYLLDFYKGLGFSAIGDIYDEDGIDHIDMVYAPCKENNM